MVKVLALAIVLSSACSTASSVKKEDWVRCWESCGKANNLRSVSKSYCFCEDGKKVLREDEVPPAKSVFEILGMSGE